MVPCGADVKDGKSLKSGFRNSEFPPNPPEPPWEGERELKTQNSKLMCYRGTLADQAEVLPDSNPSVKMGARTLTLTIVSADCDDASFAR